MGKKLNKTLFSSIVCIGLIGTISGCGKRALPEHISNTNYNQRAVLYAPYNVNQNNFLNKITNKQPRYAMRLNDYAPIGFNTDVYDMGGLHGVLWSTPKDPAIIFETNECRYKPSHVFIENLIMAPLTLGMPLLLGGGWCEYHHVFDYEQFDKAAKDWIRDEGINRKMLIDKYAELLDENSNAKSILIQKEQSVNYTLNKITQKYLNEYQAKVPKILINYQDISGFYKGEKLNSLISLKHNNVDPIYLTIAKDYTSIINNTFPCKANKECTSKMNSVSNIISNDVKKSLSEAEKELEKSQKNHIEYLKKQTKTLLIDADYKQYMYITKHKTLYYHLKKLPKVISANTKQLPVTYNIDKADFQDIFPVYQYEDNNIKVHFNPENKSFTIINKTEQFIEIDSASLYYNGSIYNLGNNSNRNFLNEFSPNGVKTFNVIPTIEESSYKNVTKKSLNGKTIKFGFAFKYTTLQPHQQHTLYKLKTYNLIDILDQY